MPDDDVKHLEDALLSVPVARRFLPQHLRLDLERKRRNARIIQDLFDEGDVLFRQGLEAIRQRDYLADRTRACGIW